MGLIDILSHLAGFVAPAAFLALALPAAARLFRVGAAGPFWRHAATVFPVAVAALAAGLWWFGRDGKIATYAAVALAAATAQWASARAWK